MRNENLLHFCYWAWLLHTQFDANEMRSLRAMCIASFHFRRRCTHIHVKQTVNKSPENVLMTVASFTLFHFGSISGWFHFTRRLNSLGFIDNDVNGFVANAEQNIHCSTKFYWKFITFEMFSSILILSRCLDNNRFALFGRYAFNWQTGNDTPFVRHFACNRFSGKSKQIIFCLLQKFRNISLQSNTFFRSMEQSGELWNVRVMTFFSSLESSFYTRELFLQ